MHEVSKIQNKLNITFLFIFTVLVYLISAKYSAIYESLVVPFGDPFTYTIGFYNILDNANQNYLRTLYNLIFNHPNWYWLLNITIGIFSPILSKNSFSIIICNFFLYFVASLSMYRLAKQLNFGEFSIIGGLIIWIFPINYGFLTYASIPVMGLDAAFTAVLYIAVAETINFSLNSRNKKQAIIAGLSAGVAVLGRGNSLLVVGLVISLPILVIVYRYKFSKSNRIILNNLFIYTALFILIGGYFYYKNYVALSGYYSNHVSFFTRHSWNLVDAHKWLVNIPGYMFWQVENSRASFWMTILLHFIELYSLIYVLLKRKEIHKEKIVILTGVYIYFFTYLINIILFTDPLFSLQNCILQYQPMIIGLALTIIGLISLLSQKLNKKNFKLINYLFISALLLNAYVFTVLQTPLDWAKGRPKPKDVELFSLGLDDMTNNGTVSILWYSYYNPQILSYYRVKNNLSEAKIFRGENYNQIWSASDYSDKNKLRVKKEIKDQFQNASIIILPEYLYNLNGQPYAFSIFKDVIAEYFKKEKLDNFRLIDTIIDSPGVNLIVLQRVDIAGGRGVRFDSKKYAETLNK